MNTYGRQLFTALRFLLCFTVVLGLAYPVAVFGVGRVVAPAQADGSLIMSDGAPVGSSLLAQPVTGDQFFHPRPSAVEWDPASSSASNLGPDQPALVEAIEANRDEVASRESVAPDTVPVDAVTASGSGLDPHISVAYATLQLPRVAAANGLSADTLRDLVAEHTSSGVNAFLGQPSVNTTTLNAELNVGVNADLGAVKESATGLRE